MNQKHLVQLHVKEKGSDLHAVTFSRFRVSKPIGVEGTERVAARLRVGEGGREPLAGPENIFILQIKQKIIRHDHCIKEA